MTFLTVRKDGHHIEAHPADTQADQQRESAPAPTKGVCASIWCIVGNRSAAGGIELDSSPFPRYNGGESKLGNGVDVKSNLVGSIPATDANICASSSEEERQLDKLEVEISKFSSRTKPRSNIMKPKLFENPINGERWVCDDVRQAKLIDGQSYISVRRPDQSRTVLMRRDSLTPIRAR